MIRAVACAIVLTVMLALFAQPATTRHASADEPTRFRLFNAMLYKDMPPFGEKQVVVYEQSFFGAGKLADGIRPSDEGIAQAVNNARIQQRHSNRPISPFIALDLERWPTWPFASQAEHLESVSHYADTARRFQQSAREPICLYSILPTGGINASTRATKDAALERQFRQANQATARRLDGIVNALCPQLYSYYRYPLSLGQSVALNQWKLFATQMVTLARELAPGLPVYPFVWPQYHHGGNVKDFSFVNDDVWRAQLEHLKTLADGIILWGGYDFGPNQPLAWDEQASWWQVLQETLPQQTRRTDKTN